MDLSSAFNRQRAKTHKQRERFLASRKRFDVIPAGRRCLAAGTMVATPTGPCPVEELSVGDEVIGWEDDQPVITYIEEFFDNGVQEVMGLTQSGRRDPMLWVTPNHRLWARPDVESAYARMEAQDLLSKFHVRRSCLSGLVRGGDKSVEMTYSLGAMLGDGHGRELNHGKFGSRQKKMVMSSDDHVVPEAVAEEIGGTYWKAKGNNFSWVIHYEPAHVVDRIPFYREWCHGRYAHEKIIDWNEVDTWDRRSCLALLAGIIDTDGSLFTPSGVESLKIHIGMQAKSVIEACRKIIFKYFGEDLPLKSDVRERYKNGPVWSIRSTSNRVSREILFALRRVLRKKGHDIDFAIHERSTDKDRDDSVGLRDSGERKRVRTYDIRVASPSNLYVLSRCGIVSSNSGKTFESRWRLIAGTKHRGGPHHGCLTPPPGVADPTYVYCAPTFNQAKRIVWQSFLDEIPKWAIAKKSEAELTIWFITGARLIVAGMDRPERVEGIAIDGVVLDEFADMKPSAWTSSIRPALSTAGRPPGWALFIGRPRGKNHFYKLFKAAQTNPKWGVYYPWESWQIMSAQEIEDAKNELDELSFRQEYGGEFVDAAGRAYYQFGDHNILPMRYDEGLDLLIGFDFNVNPGVAVICQDQHRKIKMDHCIHCEQSMVIESGEACKVCGGIAPHELVTGVIGEVFRWNVESNTRIVCQELIDTWSKIHKGRVICYGDATGGARRTSADRSDWQIIEETLSLAWPDLEIDVNRVNPGVRDRVVAMNSRFQNARGDIRIFLDPDRTPNLQEDLESTMLKGNGELHEGPEKKWTHISDALGYLVVQRYGTQIYSSDIDDDDFVVSL